eukprot:TRINITY_DN6239_c0_g1_i3.p1 TRINITY_DN6239_c0_g1~~TRINITY_DN6239_c0_g1_i3.p1  ORF type:complete len:256 (-),score=36.90 TRINITY_DN6239_c0_g1_i3:103-870(-)
MGRVSKRWLKLTRQEYVWRLLSIEYFHRCIENSIPVPLVELVADNATERIKKLKLQLEKLVLKYHGGNWRRFFLEKQLLRFDGTYVARTQYARPGVTEGVWCQPVHLVTYFRSIRFYPDGRVVSQLTSDKNDILPLLSADEKEHKKAKDAQWGKWKFDGNSLIEEDANSMMDKENNKNNSERKVFVNVRVRQGNNCFVSVLQPLKAVTGRLHRLNLVEYFLVNGVVTESEEEGDAARDVITLPYKVVYSFFKQLD